MTLHVFADIEQRSEQWHDLRRGIVTASAVGKLITPTLKVADNDYSRGLTALLAAERITGESEPSFVNDDMWRGISHEPYARDIYSGHYGAVVECGFMRRDEPMPWDPNDVARPVDEATPTWSLGLSPDGLVGDDGLIEVKCPRQKTHLMTILADEVPLHYMAQCQAALLVSGRKWVDFVSYVGGMPLWVKRVEPDPAWFEAITAAVIQFEINVAEIVGAYNTATANMPATVRPSLEIVI